MSLRVLARRWLHGVVNALRLPARAAMTRWARFHHARLPRVRFIAVTGSCGKTTTKELIHTALATRLQGVRNRGSLNGFYTTFSTVLRARRHHDFCLQELASQGPGTLDRVLPVFQPDIGVVLMVGTDHYKAFRGKEAVAVEKGRLVEALPPSGLAVLNADDPMVRAMAVRTRARVVWFGTAPEAEVRAEDVRCGWPDPLRFTVVSGAERVPVEVPFYTRHYVPNVLAALAVAREMGLSLAEAAGALANPSDVSGRLESVSAPGGITFLADVWKASTSSVPAALDALANARARRRIAVVGTLSDYPGSASDRYRRTAREMLEIADVVVFAGHHAERALKAGKEYPDKMLRAFATIGEVRDFLEAELQEGDVVLLKGSGRVDHLERLFMHRQRPVACWRTNCGRKMNCRHCRLLYRGAPAAATRMR